MNNIEKLTEYFSKLPGIGPRQAKRFVYFLLTRDDYYLKGLSENILNLKQAVNICQTCYCFFESKEFIKAETRQECDICRDKNRDDSVFMIVGKDVDMENIEKNHLYNGRYFILGGYLPILKDNASWVRSKELVNLIDREAKKGNLKEIILALSLNPEGENTAHHIKEILEPITSRHSIKITTLGKGLSTGTELEYSDDDTLKHALRNRR